MPVHIVRFGSPRAAGEGPRIGTIRRPPPGVPEAQIAARDFYDVKLPELAPSEPLVREGLAVKSDGDWRRFEERYRAEMSGDVPRHLLSLLATLSHTASFSVGCYGPTERGCHRSILRELLREHGACLETEGGP